MQNNVFPSEWMAELKRKNDMVSIASTYLRLEQKGHRFWACCPFHNEKTPSFSIDNDNGFYYCFGCKETGDVIKFVEKMENIEFYDAIKLLAEKAGMEIPEMQNSDTRNRNQKHKDRILSALDYAYKHYVENLYSKEAKQAQEYIKQRRFTRRELEDFKIGFSKNWTEIVEYLKGKGFSDEELLDAGIASKKDGRLLDVIGGRLVFPIFNGFNECIGFSARALEKTDFAKYKNTAETIIFQKGKVVYGINILKALKRQQLLDKIILVEGQMDVIAMHKAGFKQAVACMGTALTKDHVAELKKNSENIYICFDGDGAGTKATLRAIEMFRNENVNLKIVPLPDGKDPDEIINIYGKEKLQEFIDNAKPYMEFLIDYHKKRFDLNIPEEKGAFVKVMLKEIKKLETESLFEPYLEKVRDLTKVPLDVLRRDIKFSGEKCQTVQRTTEEPKAKEEKGDEKAVKYILASLLYKKDYVDKRIDYQKLLNEYGKYLDIINKNLPLSSIFDTEDVEKDECMLDILNFNFNQFEKNEEQYFKECLSKIVEQKLKEKKEKLNEAYKNCEDLTERARIAGQLGKISLQIKNKSLEEYYVRK